MKSKKRLIFHIGLPKTGTTFLQLNVFPYIKDITFFDCVHHKFNGDFDTYLNPFYLKFNNGINLISDEKICGFGFLRLPYEGMLQRVKLLKKAHPQTEIIFVSRNHISLLKSLYKQYIKHGYGVKTFSEWLHDDYDKSFDYIIRVIDYIKNNFKRYLILDYDELRNNQDKFIKRICDFIGCDFPDDYNREKVYVSPSDNNIKSIIKINKSKIFPKRFKQFFTYIFRKRS